MLVVAKVNYTRYGMLQKGESYVSINLKKNIDARPVENMPVKYNLTLRNSSTEGYPS